MTAVVWLGSLLALAAGPAPAVAEEAPVRALAEVSPGERGIALTVLEGDDIVELGVEFIARMRDALGPGQDLLLARLDGEEAAFHGVAGGMSGSPVYVDGKLVGAIAYAYGAFSKEPIAGITPIEQMLEPPPTAATSGTSADPLASPLVMVGVPPRVREHYDDAWTGMGLAPAEGAVGLRGEAPRSLQPGSPVAAVLVSGDAMVAAVGTVTRVHDDEVLAFGHSVLGEGPTDLPMATARVLLTVASWAESWKMSEVGDIVGAFRQDRLTGVRGTVGARATTTPLEVRVSRPGGARTARYEVIRHRRLTPVLVSMMVSSTLVNAQGLEAADSYRATGTMRFAAGDALPFDVFQANPEASPTAPFLLARKLAALVDAATVTPFGENAVAAITMDVAPLPGGATETVEDLTVEAVEVRPGAPVQVTVYLRSDDGRRRAVAARLSVPEDLEAGEIELHAGSEASLEGVFGSPHEARRRSARDRRGWLSALGEEPAEHGLVLRLASREPGAVVGGRVYPLLPDTVRRTMAAGRQGSRGFLTPRAILAEAREETGTVLVGSQSLRLRVVGPPEAGR